MPSKPPTPCTRCGKPATRSGLCAAHSKSVDAQRGTATQRGYGAEHERMFRYTVLDRAGWLCVAQEDGTTCGAHATHADHHPQSRRELEAAGLNPNNPDYGRALCQRHHNQHTMSTQGPAAKRRKPAGQRPGSSISAGQGAKGGSESLGPTTH